VIGRRKGHRTAEENDDADHDRRPRKQPAVPVRQVPKVRHSLNPLHEKRSNTTQVTAPKPFWRWKTACGAVIHRQNAKERSGGGDEELFGEFGLEVDLAL